MLRLLTVVIALSSSAFATVFITEPTASTTWAAGQVQTVKWQEDDAAKPPKLANFGPSTISLYVGNSQQQTLIQRIADNVDVSKGNQVTFKPDPTAGDNAKDTYFVRVESASAKDPTNPLIPALGFSAKFSMTGMTGKFTPEAKSQIEGLSTAPLGGTGVPVIGTSTVGASPTAKLTSAPTTPSPTGTSKSISTAKPTGGAVSSRHMSSLLVAAGAAAVGVFLF
jgi:hypothetical protein